MSTWMKWQRWSKWRLCIGPKAWTFIYKPDLVTAQSHVNLPPTEVNAELLTWCIPSRRPTNHLQANWICWGPYPLEEPEINTYSRYEFAFPIYSVSTCTTIWRVIDFDPLICAPCNIVSYQGTHCTAKKVQEWAYEHGTVVITHIVSYRCCQSYRALKQPAEDIVKLHLGDNALWGCDAILQDSIHWCKDLYMVLCPGRKNTWVWKQRGRRENGSQGLSEGHCDSHPWNSGLCQVKSPSLKRIHFH